MLHRFIARGRCLRRAGQGSRQPRCVCAPQTRVVCWLRPLGCFEHVSPSTLPSFPVHVSQSSVGSLCYWLTWQQANLQHSPTCRSVSSFNITKFQSNQCSLRAFFFLFFFLHAIVILKCYIELFIIKNEKLSTNMKFKIADSLG